MNPEPLAALIYNANMHSCIDTRARPLATLVQSKAATREYGAIKCRKPRVFVPMTMTLMGVVVPMLLGLGPPGRDLEFELSSPAYTRSVVLFHIRTTETFSGGAFLLEVAPDGQDFSPIHLGNSQDAWFFAEPSKSPPATTLLLPVIGSFRANGVKPVFVSAGRYAIRCTFAPNYPQLDEKHLLRATRIIDFREPTSADLAFFDACEHETVWLNFPFIRENIDTIRAGEAEIGEMLAAFVFHWLRRSPPRVEPPECAGPLFELAASSSESTYAPYLAVASGIAYLNGCSAEAFAKAGFELPDARIVTDKGYSNALRSLEFAVARGDDYVKGIAGAYLAYLQALAGEESKAERTVADLGSEARSTWQIMKYIDEAEAVINQMKASRPDE